MVLFAKLVFTGNLLTNCICFGGGGGGVGLLQNDFKYLNCGGGVGGLLQNDFKYLN